MDSAKKRAAESSDRQFVVDREGNRKAVILPLDEYERLLEDLHDFAIVAERRDEEAVDLTEMKRHLLADGLL